MKRFKFQLWTWLIIFVFMPYMTFIINTAANQRIIKKGKEITSTDFDIVQHSYKLRNTISTIDKLLVSAEKDSAHTTETYKSLSGELSNILMQMSKTLKHELEKKQIKNIQKNFKLFNKELENHNSKSASILLQDIQEQVDEMFAFYTQRIENRRDEFVHQSQKTLDFQEKTGLLALLIMGIIGIIIMYLFIRPLDRLTFLLKNYYKTHLENRPRKKGIKELKELESIINEDIEESNRKKDDNE